VLHRTNDSYRATNPADEFLGPEPSDEDELPEPVIEEVWDGGRGEYVHRITIENGATFQVQRARAGAFVGDWEIRGPGGFYVDGYSSPEKAIHYLINVIDYRNRR